MHYKNFFFIILFLFVNNCTTDTLKLKKFDSVFEESFQNKGFALVYNEDLYNNKIISKKIDERSLIIFQKNLTKNSTVKIVNILNNKTVIAKVGRNSSYPTFNNSVISLRIANELEINLIEPYIKITLIPENSMFIAKKAKTYDEEKQVANKVPIKTININNLNKKNTIKIQNKKKEFSYQIKVADFYFEDTALSMVNRIKEETTIKNPKDI